MKTNVTDMSAMGKNSLYISNGKLYSLLTDDLVEVKGINPKHVELHSLMHL